MKSGGKRVELVVLSDHYRLREIIELVGPSQPVSFPLGVEASWERDVVSVAGTHLGYLCLNIEGRVVPFLRARSLQRPKENAAALSLRLGTGTEFKIV